MSGSRDGTIDGLKSIIHDKGVMAHSRWDANFADANFPTDGEGRTLHLGTRVRLCVCCFRVLVVCCCCVCVRAILMMMMAAGVMGAPGGWRAF